MHGIIYKALKDHVVEEHGRGAWETVTADAGLDGRVYLPIDTYEDGELRALLEALADYDGRSVDETMESFGRSAALLFIETYGNVVSDDWDALDLIERVETSVHVPLRERDEGLEPPHLSCQRNGDVVTVEYGSDRRLCSVAKGLLRGVGDHYGTPLSVAESQCMLEDDAYCELVVTPESAGG